MKIIGGPVDLDGRPSTLMWPGGKSKDRLQKPSDPALLTMLANHGCRAELGENDCFDVVHRTGSYIELPYGATFDEWQEAARQLSEHD